MTKKQAQIGDLNTHKNHGKAIWKDGVRQSENEHILSKKNLQQQTTDPNTGEHSYDQKAYDNTHTLTIPKDMANLKTHGPLKTHMSDMQLIRETEKVIQGVQEASEHLKSEMSFDAAEGRMREARDIAIENREKVGLPTHDLKNLTDEKIKEAAHLDFGEPSQDMNRDLGLIPNNKIKINVEVEKNNVLKGEKATTDPVTVYEQKLTKPLARASKADIEQDVERLYDAIEQRSTNTSIEATKADMDHSENASSASSPTPILSRQSGLALSQPRYHTPPAQPASSPSTVQTQQPGLALSQPRYHTPPAQPASSPSTVQTQQPGLALSQPRYHTPPAQLTSSPSTVQAQQPGTVLSIHQQGQPPSATPAVPAATAQPSPVSPLGVIKFK